MSWNPTIGCTKMSLAYVDAICRKRKEKQDLAESKDRDGKKLRESILRAEEQRKSGKCLTLVRDCYGEKSENGLSIGALVGMYVLSKIISFIVQIRIL